MVSLPRPRLVAKACRNSTRVSSVAAVSSLFLGDQLLVAPDRLAVAAPVEREGPARQGFAGIPLALAVMQEAAGREAFAQAADQLVGQGALGRADRIGVPLAGIRSRRSRRRSARRPWSGERRSLRGSASTLWPERVEALPAFVGEGLGDARMLGDAGHLHVEGEVDIGEAGEAARSARRCGSAGWRPAECGSRRSAGPRSDRGRSSRRRADRLRTRRAGR